MADATITIGADAGQAQATLAELKQITDELFNGIGIDAQEAAVAQNALIEAFKSQKLTVLEANNAASVFRPQLESLTAVQKEAGTAAKEHGFNLKELSKSFLGTVSVVALLRENLKDLKPSLEAAGSEFRRTAQDIGLSEDSASILTNTIEMMVNPFTIVENLTANLRISAEQLAAALYDEASAADAATEAQQRKAGVLASVLSVQQKLVAEVEKSRESLDLRTEALARQIQVEQQAGEVSGAYRNKLEALLNEYDRLGEGPPQKVKDLAASLGVLSSEQEKAAKQAEHHTGKLREEKAAVQESKSEFDGILGSLKKFTDGKGEQAAATDAATKALREEIKALEDNAKAAEKAAGDAQDKLADAQARRAELEGKSVLSVEEAEELLDLQSQTASLQADAANTAEDAAQKTFEYGEAQSELAGATEEAGSALDSFAGSGDYVAQVNRELEQSSAQLGKALADMGGEAASANEIVETIGENGERKFSNVTEAAGEFGDVLVQVGEDGQYVMESIERGTEGVAQAAPAAADGVAQLGDELRNLPADDDETGIGKSRSDLEAMVNTLLPRALELGKELRDVLGSVTLGGGSGAGI